MSGRSTWAWGLALAALTLWCDDASAFGRRGRCRPCYPAYCPPVVYYYCPPPVNPNPNPPPDVSPDEQASPPQPLSLLFNLRGCDLGVSRAFCRVVAACRGA